MSVNHGQCNEDQHHENWTKIGETLSVLVTVCPHQWVEQSAIRKEKTSFHMVLEVEQQDLETSLRRVWHTRKRLSQRGEEGSMAD